MIYLVAISAVFCFVAVFASAIAAYFAIHAWTKVQAMEKSTHTIQYVPLDDKQLNKDVDNIDERLFGDLGDRDHLEGLEEMQ